MSRYKKHGAAACIFFLFSVVPVSAEHWGFYDISQTLLLDKCEQWYSALEKNEYTELESFYQPEVVARYKVSLHKDIKRQLKKHNKRKLTSDYQELERSVSIGDRNSTVDIKWSAEEGKTTGVFGCVFTKQKNGSWAFGNQVY